MKTYINISFFLLLFSSLISANLPNNNPSTSNRLKKETNVTSCQHLYGDALVDCMDSLNTEKFLIQLFLLKTEDLQRSLYFEKKLQSPEAYREFFNKFITTEDWQDFENTLTNEERKFFPSIHTAKDQDDYVSKLINYRRLKYVGIGAGVTAAVASGSYVLYSFGYVAGAAAKATEMALAAKTAAGTITAKQAVAGGTTVVVGAYLNGQNPSQEKPRQAA